MFKKVKENMNVRTAIACMELLKLKDTVSIMKNTVEWVHSQLDSVKEKINVLLDIETIRNEAQRGKKKTETND